MKPRVPKKRQHSESEDDTPKPRSKNPKNLKKKIALSESGDEALLAPSKKPKVLPKKRTVSESDDDTPKPRSNKTKSKTPRHEPEDEVPSSRSRKLTQASKDDPSNGSSGWVICSDSEDESFCAEQKSVLQSTLIRQVPGGKVRRTSQLSGDLFVELKLYNVADIKSIDPKDRWEKALVNLKIQIDSNSPVVSNINETLKLCREYFIKDGVFYRDFK
ncbi:uncharacterized protein isoform X2 [Choristoneura fumiferana]